MAKVACTLLARLVVSCLPVASALTITKVPAPSRIVAIGDIHGDFEALTDCLEFSDLYSPSKACWTGGDAVLVQTGDVLDRGTQEREILELLRTLKLQAAEAGGAVITLLGNHEYFNLVGSMGWVPKKAMTAFGEDRVAAFRPGSPLAREMSEWPVVAVVGDTAFVHAGLYPHHAREAAEINQRVAAWLRGSDDGEKRESPSEDNDDSHDNEIEDVSDASPPMPMEIAHWQHDSPLFTRKFSQMVCPPDGKHEQALLRETLQVLGASRLVVGHEIQPNIRSVYGGLLYKIDTGMSRWFSLDPDDFDRSKLYAEERLEYRVRKREALEIAGDQVTILRKGERIPAKERVEW